MPGVAKLGAAEQIRQLVNSQLPGIPLHPLPVAPRQIRYTAGFVYFELDRSSGCFDDSGGHVALLFLFCC